MSRKKSTKRARLSIESLERREMMAADFGAVHPFPTALIQSNFVQGAEFAPGGTNTASLTQSSRTAGRSVGAPNVIGNETFSTAQDLGTLPGSRTIQDFVGPSDTDDYYRFNVAQAGQYSMVLDQLSQDIELFVYDSNGQLLASSTRGGNNSEQLQGPIGVGTYFIRITPYLSAQSSYRLTLNVTSSTPTPPPPPPPNPGGGDTAGNSMPTARDLGVVSGTTTINEFVGPSDSNDYYRFTVAQAGQYSVVLDQLSQDIDMWVYNSSGQQIASSTRGGTNVDQVQGPIAAGTYFVRIAPHLSAQSSYRLTLNVTSSTPTPPPPPPPNPGGGDTAGNSMPTARDLGVVSGTTTINEFVGPSDSNDYYRFTVAQAGQYSVVLDQLSQDIDMWVYNSSGQQIASSTRGGTNVDQVQGPIAAGTYFVRIAPHLSAQSSYRLTLNVTSSTPTPPPPPPPNPGGGGFQIQLSMSGLTASQQTIFNQAARRWEQVIVGDLPDANHNGQAIDDLLINASARSIDGVGGILGQARPERVRAGSRGLPYFGTMSFDTADIAAMEQSGRLFGVIMHEIGHVLGIGGSLWQNFGLIIGAGSNNPIYVGANGRAAYNQIFGTNAAGVPVENTGQPGTRDVHFRESVLGNELMSGYAGPGAHLPLSIITVGAMADLGYSVNYAAADPYTRPSFIMAIEGSSTTSTTSALRSNGRSGSLTASLSSGTVDAAFASGSVGPTNRIAARAGHARVVADPVAAPLSVARSAAFASWNGPSRSNHVSDDASDFVVRAAFESAWDELATEVLETVVASLVVA